MNNLTINRCGGGTVFHGTPNLAINGAFTQTAGNYDLGAFNSYSLTLNGNFVQTSGSILGYTGSSFIIAGTGPLPASINVTGSLNTLTMNREGATYTPTAVLPVTNLNLIAGIVAPTGRIRMATGGTITREFGAVNAAISPAVAGSSYNVTYIGPNFNASTGLELPTDITSLNNLTISNVYGPSNTITLASPAFVNGSLTISNGTFATGNLAMSIGGDLIVGTNGIFQPGTSIITFDGGGAQSINSTATTPLLTFSEVIVNQSPPATVSILSPVDIQNRFNSKLWDCC